MLRINIEDYFDEEKIKTKELIVNEVGTRYVFREEVDAEVFFIKKYTPRHRKKRLRIFFHLERDKALHYKYISDILKKLNINHMPPIFIKIKKLFRESIFVTRYGSEPLSKILKTLDLEQQKSVLNIF